MDLVKVCVLSSNSKGLAARDSHPGAGVAGSGM